MNDWTYNFRIACSLVGQFNPSDSLVDLIETNEGVFADLIVLYSTNNVKFDISGLSFIEIEKKYKNIKWIFCADGLEFYLKHLWKVAQENGAVLLPSSIQLAFDSNVSESIRKFVFGRDISNQEVLFNIIRFIKDYKIRIDFSFFVFENLRHSLIPENSRPLETIASLKLLDSIDYRAFLENHFELRFKITEEEAFSQAEVVLKNFNNSTAITDEVTKQLATYAILLKAIDLYFNKKLTPHEKMSHLFIFCIETMNKILKLELYMCWKFFVFGNKIKFFAPILSRGRNIIKISKGMSWDIFVFRHQLMQLYKSKFGKFVIPMFCTFDNKFLSLLEVCSLRSCIINPNYGRCELLFEDEISFQVFLSESISAYDAGEILSSAKSRTESKLNKYNLDRVVQGLEEKVLECLT